MFDHCKFNVRSRYTLLIDEEPEQISRRDMQHIIMRHHLHGNFNAPLEEELEEGIKVLELGCGSGRWIRDMAEDYPRSSFTGVDVTEVYPTSDIPVNCTFVNADVRKSLPFEDGEFDYVFQRFMVLSYTPEDWHAVTRELVRVTKPGGWLELFEQAATVERPPVSMTVWNAALAETKSRGIDVSYAWQIGNLLKTHGMSDVIEDYVSFPIGWGESIAEFHAYKIFLLYLAMEPTLAPALGVKHDEYVRLTEMFIDGLTENRSWFKAPYAYGRKPLNY